MSSSARPPSKLYDLDVTVISAKHLKNVNWRHGDLKALATLWLDPLSRFTTKVDESGSTRPVWNERFTIPITTLPLHDSLLTIEISHLDSPTLVGNLQFPLKDLLGSEDLSPLRTLPLRRPSGRPQGKIRLKLALRDRPAPPPPPNTSRRLPPTTREYRSYAPPSPYSSAHAPPPVPVPAAYSYSGYSDPYPGYYSGYYSHSTPPPPPPPRPFFERSSYGGMSGPSAPVVDYSGYEQKPRGSKMGLGAGLAVGAVAGALGGLALEEGLKYEEEKIAERAENDLAVRDDYSDYHRVDY
ncbi:hypothetical protein Sjap_001039 [Stephania japonica]|uniref:C2 domain-containing protein n=1 Tax=Stephania japonica TaxID=461633 RepID=A0AAP0KKZ4_9MAGN